MTETKSAIKRQLMREYVKKDFSFITVKEICMKTPVARTTFYSYYNNLSEVLEEIEDDIISGLMKITDEISCGKLPDMDFIIYMDAIEDYIIKNKNYIKAFLVTQPNYHFIRKWKDAIKLNFSKRYPSKVNAKNYDAISEIISSSLISAYTYWMEHPDKSNIKEMKIFIKKLLDSLVTFI